MNTAVDLFVQEKVKDEYRPIVAKFRALVRKKYPNLKEEMRGGTEKYHGVPVYRNKRIVMTLSPTQKGITFSFTDGKMFEDTFHLLEGVGNRTLNLSLSSVDEYKDALLEYYIKQAVRIDDMK